MGNSVLLPVFRSMLHCQSQYPFFSFLLQLGFFAEDMAIILHGSGDSLENIRIQFLAATGTMTLPGYFVYLSDADIRIDHCAAERTHSIIACGSLLVSCLFKIKGRLIIERCLRFLKGEFAYESSHGDHKCGHCFSLFRGTIKPVFITW